MKTTGTMAARLYTESTHVLRWPDGELRTTTTNYYTVTEPGELAVSVSINGLRGPWCSSCESDECAHVAFVRAPDTACTRDLVRGR